MVSFSVGSAQEVIQLPHSEIINLPSGAYPNGTILGDIDNGYPFIISNGMPFYIGETKIFKGKVGYRGTLSTYFDNSAAEMYDIVGECICPTWLDFNFPIRFYASSSNPRPKVTLTARFIDRGEVVQVNLIEKSLSYQNPNVDEVVDVISGKFRLSDYQPAESFGCVSLRLMVTGSSASDRALEQDVDSYLKMYSGTVPADVFSVENNPLSLKQDFNSSLEQDVNSSLEMDSGTFSANASFLED